jgi:dTDP-glucose pyrophosphorylase
MSKRGEYEIPDAIQMMIDDKLKVKGLISNKWVHISNIQDFLVHNFEYIQKITSQ